MSLKRSLSALVVALCQALSSSQVKISLEALRLIHMVP